MEPLKTLFKNRQWSDISTLFTPKDLADQVNLKDGLIIANELLNNEDWDEELQEYAVKLLFELKKRHSDEWDSNWKYDAFLGVACDITLKYDERFQSLMRAFEKNSSPPPELMIELARCCYCPGSPPLSYDQSIELLKRSISDHPYKRAGCLLKAIYSSKKDLPNAKYWSDFTEKMKDEEPPSLAPEFLKRQ